MDVRVALTCLDIVALAAVLGGFVFVITGKLQKIADALGQVAGGVEAIEGHTKILHAGADAINSNLNAAARNLGEAVGHAQALGGG
jgi:imidazole glycerol phosphate synthase subunit HisF